MCMLPQGRTAGRGLFCVQPTSRASYQPATETHTLFEATVLKTRVFPFCPVCLFLSRRDHIRKGAKNWGV